MKKTKISRLSSYTRFLEKLALKLQKRALRFISIFLSEFSIRFLYLLMRAGGLPLKCSYYELLVNLIFETRHRNALGNN